MIIEGVTIVYHLSMNEAKKAPLMRSNCWQYDIYGDKGENLWLSIQLEEIGIKQKFLSSYRLPKIEAPLAKIKIYKYTSHTSHQLESCTHRNCYI
jgi:hypothetical protein